MTRQNLLPILRQQRVWIALALAVVLLFVSSAWMDKTAADNRAEIDRVYEEMDVHFLLNAGRRSLSPGFTISLYQIRRIEHWEFFEDFGCDPLRTNVMTSATGRMMSSNWLAVHWVCDPEAAGIRVLEGELGEGFWMTRDYAERYGVSVGGLMPVYMAMSLRSEVRSRSREFPVTAIIECPVHGVYMSEEGFDDLIKWTGNESPSYTMTDLHFSLKKEYNRRMSEIEKKLQALLNTPNPYDRNRDITVNYNASEIDGMLKPLEKSVESAEFFGKLFRTVLPVVAYMIELIAILGLRNEIGVRQFLGENRAAVFCGIWLPVFVLCLPGYLLSAAVLLLTPLGEQAPWGMTLWHLAGTAALTALLTGILCAVRPLDLLREKEHE
ncbi:MAG: hypothetical protein IKZ41_03400 [Clostridia bacterium]|nr:hypothetical protein [Clostridia bacterium]MBR5366048.1 hypothetical protein [Clostridia bacterium]